MNRVIWVSEDKAARSAVLYAGVHCRRGVRILDGDRASNSILGPNTSLSAQRGTSGKVNMDV